MAIRENKSELLIALHNAIVCMDIVYNQLKEKDKNDLSIHSLKRDTGVIKDLLSNSCNIEKNILEEILRDFNAETYGQCWENVKTWYDKKGKLKILNTHHYDLSIEVLNIFIEKLENKYFSDFNLEEKLILGDD